MPLQVCITISATRTTRSIRQAFLDHTLRQEIWYFDRHDNGAIAVQATTNGNRIQLGIAEKLSLSISALSMFFSSFIVALSVQWKLSLITMSIIPVLLIVTGVCIMIDSIQETRITKIYSRAASHAQETLSSMRTVQAFWAQKKMVARYDEFLQQAHTEGKKKSPNYGILFSTEYFCVYSAIALAFWQGYQMYRAGDADVGQVFTVLFSVEIAATSASMISPQITGLVNAASAASELFSIIDKPSLLDPLGEEGMRPADCHGHIEVRNLDFAYPSRPSTLVLRGLNITIPARRTTALVGASGCGKSTLIGLLERWYEPTGGVLCLDGLSLSDYNVAWLRNQVRLVQQEPVLFSGTVFENVAKGMLEHQRSLPYEQQMVLVREACKASNADNFIQCLPQGYETEVGERASMLSGGQKQRIAIARSIISDPKILLLDEATSALDPKAEKVVQDALDRVSTNRTTLVIAHKLATVKNADNIAVMSMGYVVEQGTHEELLMKNGHYAALVAAQDLGGDKDIGHISNSVHAERVAMDDVIEKEHISGDQLSGTTSTPTPGELLRSETASLNYSLVRCLIIMLSEQPSLYPWFALSTIACLIGGATYPAQAILFSRLLDVFQLPGDEGRRQVNFYSLMFFVVALANLVAYFTIGWICNVIAQTIIHRYRREMFEQILHQDMQFFDRPENSSGALTSKLSTVPTQLFEMISINLLLIFIVLINILSSSILAISYGWKLGLVVVFGGLPPLIGAGYARIRLETRIEVKNDERFATSATLANEAVSAIRTVASLALERQILQQYSDMLSNIVAISIRSTLKNMIFYALSQSLDFLVMALGFWYGAQLLASGEYTTEQFYIIFIGVLFAGQAAAVFFGYSTSLTKAVGAANYILWLRTLKPTIRVTKDNQDLGPDGDAELSLQSVGFRYPQRQGSRVLRNLSMEVSCPVFHSVSS